MRQVWTVGIKNFVIAGLVAVTGLIAVESASARTLVLEGSDASTFHGDQTGGDTYTTQLIAFLREGSALPVAVFRNVGDTGDLPTAPAGSVVYVSDLSALSTATYSALYIMSPSGCCSQNLAGAQVFASEIGAFYAAGGSVAIQDYEGGDWSFVTPVLATPPAGSVISGFCSDGQVFNAEGLSKGFTQPPALGCWEHQAYDNAHFVTTLGFLSLVDADPSIVSGAGWNSGGSAFLALGGALGDPGCTNPLGCDPGDPTAVPEPATLTLLGLGLAAVRTLRRKESSKIVS